jgi:hypothetical protein
MFLLGIPTLRAQEEPIPPKRARAAKVGLFAGFTPGWLSVNVNPINDFLVSGKGAPLKDQGVFMYGGAGSVYILVVPNLRVGGVGMSGSSSSVSIDPQGVRRDAKLNVGFGGVTVEYVFTLMDRMDLALGTMLGTGGIDITLRHDVGGNDTWDGEGKLWSSWPNGAPTNTSRTLSGSFYVVVPSVSVEYALLGYLAVRIGASYVEMFAPTWKVDENHDLVGVPSDVTGRGFMIHAGILVGTF